MTTGKFIVLEGIDGSGTTTQTQLLANYLYERDKRNIILLTREPTELSREGQEVRRRLSGRLAPGEEVNHDPEYWTQLFIADRRWHLDQFVVPTVMRGGQVISDRHKLSTLAYQSAQGMNMDDLIRRHERFYQPQLTLVIDVPVAIALERIGKVRQGSPDYFERKDFQEKVRANYLLAVEKLPGTEPIVVLDGTKSIAEVAKAIQAEVNKLYGYQ